MAKVNSRLQQPCHSLYNLFLYTLLSGFGHFNYCFPSHNLFTRVGSLANVIISSYYNAIYVQTRSRLTEGVLQIFIPFGQTYSVILHVQQVCTVKEVRSAVDLASYCSQLY